MTGLSDFIRTGGGGSIALRAGRAPSTKDAAAGIGVLRGRFALNLDFADVANADTIGRVVGRAFDPPLTQADMADLSADKDEALRVWEERVAVLAAEWGGQPDRFNAVRLQMEDDLLRAFAALANERRQAFLGLTHYVWRSRDDERVRHAHAAHDDRVFDWEEPPEGGHPGMAFGCRCWAQPWIEPEEPYAPLTDAELLRLAARAEEEGQDLATRDAILGPVDSVLAIFGAVNGSERILFLQDRERDGTLSPAEAEELARLRATVETGLRAAEEAASDPLGTLTDALDLPRRLSIHADDMTVAYLEGRATEAMLAAAHRDAGYAHRSLVMAIAMPLTAIRLPSRRGLGAAVLDREALRRFWRDESGAVGPRTIGWDWQARQNQGIQWGGPIRLQGDPWEEMLDRGEALGDRLPPTFPVIDFYDRATRVATSAKTLHSQGRSYLDRPSGVYDRLRGYVDKLAGFSDGRRRGQVVTSDMIEGRRLELAIPSSTTTEQMLHVQRAIEYARSRGVEMVVTRIN